MRIRNTSKEAKSVMPHTGPSFTCPAGAEVVVADVCGAELVASFPEVWASVDAKPKKSKKEI